MCGASSEDDALGIVRCARAPRSKGGRELEYHQPFVGGDHLEARRFTNEGQSIARQQSRLSHFLRANESMLLAKGAPKINVTAGRSPTPQAAHAYAQLDSELTRRQNPKTE